MTAIKKYIQIQLTSQEEDGSEKDDRDREERAAESLKSEIKIENLKKLVYCTQIQTIIQSVCLDNQFVTP